MSWIRCIRVRALENVPEFGGGLNKQEGRARENNLIQIVKVCQSNWREKNGLNAAESARSNRGSLLMVFWENDITILINNYFRVFAYY